MLFHFALPAPARSLCHQRSAQVEVGKCAAAVEQPLSHNRHQLSLAREHIRIPITSDDGLDGGLLAHLTH